MNRRNFFLGSKNKNESSNTSIRTTSGLSVYTGTFSNSELVHLLKRSLFGARPSDVINCINKPVFEVINLLLTKSPIPTPPVNTYNDADYTDQAVGQGEIWTNAPYTDDTANSRRYLSLKAWWAGLMLNQQMSIHEKMVLFWHNHFATEVTVIGDARFAFKHNALLRSHALGNFKNLLKQVSVDPAMLKYLNGYLNTKEAPDENYSRELQELFTVGKGPDSYYTEDDVKAAAKILTGYRIDEKRICSTFDEGSHDASDKRFSAFYDSKVIIGKVGASGAKEVDELLNLLLSRPETALNICRKLYRFFVYYNIDNETEVNVIKPLATIFKNGNYEILPVLKALFSSEHFFDPVNRGGIIKSPVDFTVGLCREFEIVFPDHSDIVNQYYMWHFIRTQAGNMLQDIGDPPNVAGWPAYYQAPQFHEIWINSDTINKRNELTDRLIGEGYTRRGKTIIIDVVALAEKMSNPSDVNSLIHDSLLLLYTIEISQASKNFLKSILLSGQTSEYYWTEAWNIYKKNTSNVTARNTVSLRLKAMYKYLMNMPEYQLS